SGSADTTVLLWDIYAQRRKARSITGSGNELDALWRDLSGKDGACAFDAMCSLRLMPAAAVNLFKDRLRPRPLADADKTKQLLEDLASDRFAVRKQATQELERLADSVETELRQAAIAHPLPEVRRRAEILLRQ